MDPAFVFSFFFWKVFLVNKCGSKLVFAIRNNSRLSINKIGNKFNSLDPLNEFNKIGNWQCKFGITWHSWNPM